MSKAKKKVFVWRETLAPYNVCENPDSVLSIYTYGNKPLLVFNIRVAYYDETTEAHWDDGRKTSESCKGWKYALSCYVGAGWEMIMLAGHEGKIRSNTTTYPTRKDAVRAAIEELLRKSDEHLLTPSNSSQPYWGPSQGRYFSRPGSEQLAYYLCLPEMEPLWQLIEEVEADDKWLAEVRAPKKTVFTAQLSLF